MKPLTLQQLIKNLKLDYVNPGITDTNFPPQPLRGEVKIFHFNRYISSEDAIKEMEKEGYEPANVHELLTWAKDSWNGTDWIVALNSPWPHLGDRLVPCLDRYGSGRRLALRWTEFGWNEIDRFAGVKKESKSSDTKSRGPLEKKVIKAMDEKLEEIQRSLDEVRELLK